MFGAASGRYLGHLRVLAERVRRCDPQAAVDLIAEGRFATFAQACTYVCSYTGGPLMNGWFDTLADAWAALRDPERPGDVADRLTRTEEAA